MDDRLVGDWTCVATLKRELLEAQEKAKLYEYQLIAFQHSDLQRQDRADQLQEVADEVNLCLQALQSELGILQCASPSDEEDECGPHSSSVADMQLRSHELRLRLQQAQIDSLRASRDHLLTSSSVAGGAAPTEVQMECLLQYTHMIEALLDSHAPAMTRRYSAKDVATDSEKQYRDFLYNSRSAGVQLESQLSKSHLRQLPIGSISNASTSVGSSSVRSQDWDSTDHRALVKNSVKQKKAQHVRFRPPLRMHRDRSASPSADDVPRRSSSVRRRSATERVLEQGKRHSGYSLTDFSEWYT